MAATATGWGRAWFFFWVPHPVPWDSKGRR